MEFSSISCSVERLNFEVFSQDDRFDVMPRGLIELTSVFSSEYRFLYGKAIQKLVSSFQLRAIPALCINLNFHIRITKAFWETGKTSSILLVW